MSTEIGEYIVGAYLQQILECDVVTYNIRPPGGGMKGLEELDVLGINFKSSTTYLCEVTTHIRGLLYKSNSETIRIITKKHENQKEYADKHLSEFNNIYMFWSPAVPHGYLTENLARIKGLEIVINTRYKKCVEEMKESAKVSTHFVQNPFFRTLQILQHIRD